MVSALVHRAGPAAATSDLKTSFPPLKCHLAEHAPWLLAESLRVADGVSNDCAESYEVLTRLINVLYGAGVGLDIGS